MLTPIFNGVAARTRAAATAEAVSAAISLRAFTVPEVWRPLYRVVSRRVRM